MKTGIIISLKCSLIKLCTISYWLRVEVLIHTLIVFCFVCSPCSLSFPVIFYRKDIFEQLNLSVPETWEELQELIPYLEAENMSLFFQERKP